MNVVKICKTILSIALLSSLLVACATDDGVKGAYPPKVAKTIPGAVVGGASGAAIGSFATSSASAGAVFGGAIGAMVGGGLGAYYENKDLQKALKDGGVTLIRLGDIVEFVIPADNLFDPGENELKGEADQTLSTVTTVLREYGPVDITVTAHTDNIGSQAYRLDFSKQQAQAVATYLWTHGINLKRLHYHGMGDTQDVATNLTSLGSAYNRRIEITLWRQTDPSTITGEFIGDGRFDS